VRGAIHLDDAIDYNYSQRLRAA